MFGVQVWVFSEMLYCCVSHLCGEKLGALCCVGGQSRLVKVLSVMKKKMHRKDFPSFLPDRVLDCVSSVLTKLLEVLLTFLREELLFVPLDFFFSFKNVISS